MTTSRLLPALVVLTLGALAAAQTQLTGTARSEVPACPETIMIEDFAFSPASCWVKAGATVKFMNMDAMAHTATSDPGTPAAFDTGRIAKGQTASVKLEAAGSYAYHCAPHPA